MSFSHVQFKELIERVGPTLSAAESLAVRAVAWHETNYASGWKTPEAKASRNLGAITRQPITKLEDGSVICEPPNFAHGDSLRDPKTGEVVQYQTCFAGYENFELAAEDLIREVLKDNVRKMANAGSLRGVAKMMRKNRYYLGTAKTETEQVDAYLGALERAVGDIVERTGEPNPFAGEVVAAPSSPRSDLPRSLVSSPSLLHVGEPRRSALRMAERMAMRELREKQRRASEISPAAREAMARLAQTYLHNVPPAYIHMAVALRNLTRFSTDELRAELERRDEQPAFPDPSRLQEEIEALEDAALEEAAAAIEARASLADEPSGELDFFEGETELPDPEPIPPSKLPSTVPDNPRPDEPAKE